MIILNYMTLLEINSFDIYKCFLSYVSIDAYDCVMITYIYIYPIHLIKLQENHI